MIFARGNGFQAYRFSPDAFAILVLSDGPVRAGYRDRQAIPLERAGRYERPQGMTRGYTTTLIVSAGVTVLALAAVAYRLGLRHSETAASPSMTQSAPQSGCLDLESAAKHTGENSCVAARVLRVFTSRSGNTFLDFCSDYRQCPFTTIIFASDRSRFGNLSALEGRRVEIRGEITSYKGRAEIIVHHPKQISAVP